MLASGFGGGYGCRFMSGLPGFGAFSLIRREKAWFGLFSLVVFGEQTDAQAG